MTKLILTTILAAATLLAQTTINGGRTITGAWDASGASSTKPVKTGTTSAIPGTCAAGDLYWATDGQPGRKLRECGATNTWDVIAYGQGTTNPAACAVGDIYFDTDATAGANLQLCTATNTWTAISGGAGGGGYAAIQDEGAAQTARTTLNFIGRGAKAEDDTTRTNVYFLDPRKYVFWWDDFITQNNSTSGNIGEKAWGLIGSGVGSSAAVVGHPGLINMNTAANATNGLYVGSFNNRAFLPADFSSFLIILSTDTADTDLQHYRIGLLQDKATTYTDGIYFEMSGTDVGWWGAVMAASAETRTATALLPFVEDTHTVFYAEKIAANQIRFKAAATVAAATDMSSGSQTITATLPTTAMYLVIMLSVDAGGATTYFTVDYADMLLSLTR
jgi:hypothetical protein